MQMVALMFLEMLHLVDMRKAKRNNVDPFATGNLPHVDSLSSKKTSKGGEGGGMDSTPILKTIVLIGGGHTHAYTLKNFGMKPIPGVRLVLITRDVMTPYSGMLPGHIAGHYTKEECHIDLLRLARFAKATMIHGEACGIDFDEQRVSVKGRPSVGFDLLSIDIGSAPAAMKSGLQTADVPLTPVKPIDGFSARWDCILERVVATKKPLSIVVVGGGAGGVEMVLSMQTRLVKELEARGKSPSLVNFTVATRSHTVLQAHSPAAQRLFRDILKERQVVVETSCEVTSMKKGALVCANGKEITCNEVIWCTQAGCQSWLKDTGLQLDDKGFIAVGPTMQSKSHPEVFAAGDCCAMIDNPRPKAGVFAVRAGPPLTNNLRRLVLGQGPLEKFEPQSSFLGIIGTGDKRVCVASRGAMAMRAAWLWDLKDWIDRKWMAGYTHGLPKMEDEKKGGMAQQVAAAMGEDALNVLSHASMRCGGCGAKVGASVLSQVLRRLKQEGLVTTRKEVLVGLDSPDDCAVVKAPSKGKSLVQTVDFFRSFIDDPYVFGQIAANHALSDCHAMCAEAVSALAVVVVPFAVEDAVAESVYQMMAGACKQLGESKCALVGGHTCEGSEMALGFTINGVVNQDEVLNKGGMRPGDVVIITKPIGTGTVFAAEMRMEAKGAWVHEAVQSMVKSNHDAAICLMNNGATSCTDITGFGVLGHLVEMVKASEKVAIKLDLASVPMLKGAQECIDKGIFSSLQPSNLRARRALANEEEGIAMKGYPLLFDPQTAGGLLATCPKKTSKKCIKQLKELGYESACIVGTVTKPARGADPDQTITLTYDE